MSQCAPKQIYMFLPKKITLFRQYFYILFIPDMGISTKNVLPNPGSLVSLTLPP